MNKKTILLIGLGRFGLHIAKKLQELGHEVMAVDVNEERLIFSEHYSCPHCGFTVGKLEPAMFSFNSPLGACPHCHGLGVVFKLDPSLLIVDENLSIADGAIRYLKNILIMLIH